MMERFLVLIALLLPVGCLAQTEPPEVPQDTCGATALGDLVGRDKSALEGRTGEATVRILAPDQPMTMDFNGARLNVDIDDAGTIVKLWCG